MIHDIWFALKSFFKFFDIFRSARDILYFLMFIMLAIVLFSTVETNALLYLQITLIMGALTITAGTTLRLSVEYKKSAEDFFISGRLLLFSFISLILSELPELDFFQINVTNIIFNLLFVLFFVSSTRFLLTGINQFTITDFEKYLEATQGRNPKNTKEQNSSLIKFLGKQAQTIDAVASVLTFIVTVFAFLFVIPKVVTVSESNINMCPSVHSGAFCNVEPSVSCDKIDKITARCDSGDLQLDIDVYNKGLAMALNVESNVRFKGIELTDNPSYIVDYLKIYINGKNSQTFPELGCMSTRGTLDICGMSQAIGVISPNQIVRVTYVIPEERIMKYPTDIIFELKENGITKIEKIADFRVK